jgi:ATP-dependent DNA helicase RecG
MNLSELQQLVSLGESETLEFKASTAETTSAIRTACAMLNKSGGTILFGVRDDGRIVGQDVGQETIERLANDFARLLNPPGYPTIEAIPLGLDRSVICMTVDGNQPDAFTCDGRFYGRFGSTTRVLSASEIPLLLKRRSNPLVRWEIQQAESSTLSDIDEAEVARTVRAAIAAGRMADPGTTNTEDLLRGFGLIRDDHLLNGALALFGKLSSLRVQMPQCSMTLGRCHGTTKDSVTDTRMEFGNAFALFEMAQTFFLAHLPVAARIVPDAFEREDIPAYPTVALREALMNAIGHRDYAAWNGSINVAIYDDRLEISSVGLLPHELTVEDLFRPHASVRRNPTMSDVLFRRGLIEQFGSGIGRMVQELETAGLPRPEIEEVAGTVVIRFKPDSYVPPTKVSHHLSPSQREILGVLQRAGPASLADISTAMPTIRPKAIQKNLQVLRELGLIEITGQRRWARWALASPTTE